MYDQFSIRLSQEGGLRHYEPSVVKFEQGPIEKGRILFYGSSGFTRWKPFWGNRALEDDIRMKDGSPAAVNHGMGGSTAEDLLYYYDRAVRPWEPRALVLRVWPNDFRQGYSAYEIMFLCSRILAYARADFPGIKLYACDAAPQKRSIGSEHFLSNAKQFNALLKDYCDNYEDTTYLCHCAFPGFFADPADVGDYFKVRQDIYINDGVHFTQEGYDIYRDFFLQALDDIL